MILEAVQLLVPERVLLGLGQVEAAGAEHLAQFDLAEIHFHQPRIRIQPDDDLACGVPLLWCRRADLVEHDDIGKLDLFDQQVDQCAGIAFA
ncbi:hypothetical protein D3C72_2055330 [compost metagenome]